jgi:hypothetical protein
MKPVAQSAIKNGLGFGQNNSERSNLFYSKNSIRGKGWAAVFLDGKEEHVPKGAPVPFGEL